MGIRQDLATLKTLASQGGELLLLRLRVLQMDANEQLRGVLVIAALIVLAAVVLVVMLVALLLGLNVVLTAQAKIWLFFSVAAACRRCGCCCGAFRAFGSATRRRCSKRLPRCNKIWRRFQAA